MLHVLPSLIVGSSVISFSNSWDCFNSWISVSNSACLFSRNAIRVFFSWSFNLDEEDKRLSPSFSYLRNTKCQKLNLSKLTFISFWHCYIHVYMSSDHCISESTCLSRVNNIIKTGNVDWSNWIASHWMPIIIENLNILRDIKV